MTGAGVIVPPTLEELRLTGGVMVGVTVGESEELLQLCGVHQNIHHGHEIAEQEESDPTSLFEACEEGLCGASEDDEQLCGVHQNCH